ncbi:hypothetical protein JCM10908_004259 [Rhodotorula pacifica]|uniref:Rso55p n=1 Tax=Rhodotorula pacifica TaxID=1495444 RepID=UPI00317F1610
MLATRLTGPARRIATRILVHGPEAWRSPPARPFSSSLTSTSSSSLPHASTSRLTLDHDLGGEHETAKPKPKGKAKTPPKNRQPKTLPELNEEELEEQFVRGSGPGGQATNKTSNACRLLHKPTGLQVFCHETRSRETNRKLARRIMREKLDQLLSPPGESARDLKAARERAKAAAKKRKARRKAEAKAAEKAGNDPNGRASAERDEDEDSWEDADDVEIKAEPDPLTRGKDD